MEGAVWIGSTLRPMVLEHDVFLKKQMGTVGCKLAA